ncbi:MAG: GxxExxY protein [Phycisphaeraceae bacterium]
MNTDKTGLNKLSKEVIGAAYEVSNVLGVGFLERVYEKALLHEIGLRGLHVQGQHPLEVSYKGAVVGNYVADILVENQLLVELKCCDAFAPEHMAQCINYLRATGLTLALLLNFQRPRIEIKRIAL